MAVFADQGLITPENLKEKIAAYAQAAKLDMTKFEQCYDHQSTQEALNADIAEAKNLGVGSTPTFLINGRVILGSRNIDEFKEVIDLFLKKRP